MKKAHRSQFIKEVKEKYPELRVHISQEQGLLSLELAVFGKFIQQKIDNLEKDIVTDAFQILNKFYINGNLALKHAIRDLVCEDLIFSDTQVAERRWAFILLPEALKEERIQWFTFMGYERE
ncbi:hypothetical protein PN836_004085 [Ningiella sp. W23]|uniref:DUF7674 family protein n=1 Tax=Ningiella sp. W23 TaxID=3023715 RepID=UPI0037578E5F